MESGRWNRLVDSPFLGTRVPTATRIANVALLRCMFLLLCRFLAAGNDDLTTRSGGRRPKSAKARNRVGG